MLRTAGGVHLLFFLRPHHSLEELHTLYLVQFTTKKKKVAFEKNCADFNYLLLDCTPVVGKNCLELESDICACADAAVKRFN